MKTNLRMFLSQTLNLSKAVFLSLVVVITLASAGCSDKPSNDKTKSGKSTAKNAGDKKEKAAIPVEVIVPSRGDIQQTYRTITTLEAENDAQVVARSTGLVQQILVEEGDVVIKGQKLAQLDVEQLLLELAQIEATLNKLKNEMDRQQKLFTRKLGSSDALERAQFEYQSQKAQHQLSQLKLNYASIKAPISGIITQRSIKQGNLVRDNDILFKIVDLDSLIAVLYLPEKELSNVKKMQKVLLDIDAMKGKLIVGEIDRIRPSIDTNTGTFRVVAKIGNDDHFLKSGMFGKVEVVFDTHLNSLILPQETIITQDNRSHVFVVVGDQALQKPIELGFRHNGRVEVLSGLGDSDKVISTGQQILKHQAKVEIVSNDATSIAPVVTSVVAPVVTEKD
ncbi:MAG: efflux RND transporter periplasmic adaptor subunit, partial [Psychrosphaera sp.]|nr:efflux RND transporter periplasmic adaptor subunit [Psychrosphaera sp.]